MVGVSVLVGANVCVGAGDGMAVGFRETVGSPVGPGSSVLVLVHRYLSGIVSQQVFRWSCR